TPAAASSGPGPNLLSYFNGFPADPKTSGPWRGRDVVAFLRYPARCSALEPKEAASVPGITQGRFGPGVEDLIILPLVLTAVTAKTLLQATFSILIHVLDYAFPILLQLMRFPLITARIIGDGVAALLMRIVGYFPVSNTRREALRELVNRNWSWLRQRISYKAFEEAVHHAFEAGMGWVFTTCRTLTPRGALLVMAGAVLWLPVSLVAATAMHTVLIAKAASLPPGMQLWHPVASFIAKSKLLVLPVYPAAWPQAKKHPFAQAIFQIFHHFTSLRPIQKTRYRYRQMECAAAETANGLRRTASLLGLDNAFVTLLAGLNGSATSVGKASSAAVTSTIETFSRIPLIGPIIRQYAVLYDRAGQRRAERLSERVRSFFERGSIKFSAEYYETKKDEPTRAPDLGLGRDR